MQSETVLCQVAARSFYENFAQRCQSDSPSTSFASSGHDFAERHKDVIMSFGRFPSRNTALGKKSNTELRYLKEHPNGF